MAALPHILVIDDDPLFRKVLVGLLKKSYRVSAAETGSQGYDMAVDHPPHVALIDVQMPGWDGLQTLKKFREHEILSATRMAILTGDASRETVVTAIRGGADEYIVKTNFSKEELLRKLKALVSRSSLPVEEFEDDPSSEAAIASSANQSKTSRTQPPVAVTVDNSRLQEVMDDWE